MSEEIAKQEVREVAEVVTTQETEAFKLLQRQAQALSVSQLIPAHFQGKVADCMIALEMAQRINAPAMSVLQSIYIVHGKPSWASTYIISIINSSGRFAPLRFYYDGEGDNAGCTAYTMYADGEKVNGPRVSIKMAKAEGWMSKKGSKWQTMPELMLSYRAATFFGRLYCPDLLMGIRPEDELNDIHSSDDQPQTVKSDLA